jgi:acylphosphatase
MELPNINFTTKTISMIAKRALFEGRVQGVGFRYTIKQLAMGFDVVGWVKNLPDGSVELQLMGEEDEVEEFLREIVEESSMARNIKDMHTQEIPPLDDAKGFRMI